VTGATTSTMSVRMTTMTTLNRPRRRKPTPTALLALLAGLSIGLPGAAWAQPREDAPQPPRQEPQQQDQQPPVAEPPGAAGEGAAEAAVSPGTDTTARARKVKPADAPELSAAVRRLVAAEYLTPEERSELRVFHGIWEDGDLDSPARMARAALLVGAYDDPALSAPDADVLDRAEAALRRGEAGDAADLVADRAEARAVRIRVEALEALGRRDEAVAAAQPLIDALAGNAFNDPQDRVEAVRALAIHIRLAGPVGGGVAGDFHSMMAMLAAVREGANRLYWPAMLMEAELLLERDNPAEAQAALTQVLSLNPSCARAWYLLGCMAVNSFNFDASDQIAARLDALGEGLAAGPSPLAAALRARALLRLQEGEPAAAVLDEALRTYPHHRELLALRAAAQAVRFDLEGAERLAAEFEAASPGSADALFEIGRALSEARQYDAAAEYLRRAHERLPTWPAPVIELGLLQIQAGRDNEALSALRAATRLDPFNVRAANSLRLVTELAGYDALESEHFIVRYKPGPEGPGTGADAALAREMLPVLEQIHATVAGDGPGGIAHEPPVKTTVDLMPNHRWFGVRIAGMPAIHTIAASTGPVIAMEAPRDGAQHLGTYDWARVVRHEYVHTVTLSRTNNRIPHWFTEAAAVYLEQAPRDLSTARMLASALENDSLFDFVEINISFVRPKKPTDRSQAYAQGHWMYEFMIERFGREAPLRLMDLYAQGVREESAFNQVLGMGRDEFLAQFKAWARRQVVSWGLALPQGVPTVKELLRAEAKARPREPGVVEVPSPMTLTGRRGPRQAGGGDDGDAALPAITLEMVDRWLEKYPEHPDLLELAVDLRIRDNGGEATPEMAPLLERYAAARPVDPMPHRRLAQLYLSGRVEGKGPEAAIPHLEYLDAREQKTPAYAQEIARRYAAMGDWDRAGAFAERATQIAPYSGEMRELAAAMAIKRGDLDTAERHLWALTQIEPDRPAHQDRLAALRKMRGGRD